MQTFKFLSFVQHTNNIMYTHCMHFYGLKKEETSYTYILLLLYHYHLRCFSIKKKKGFRIIFQVFFNEKEMSTDYCSIMHGESVNFPSSSFGWSVPNLSCIRCRTPRPALALLCFPHICFHSDSDSMDLNHFFSGPSMLLSLAKPNAFFFSFLPSPWLKGGHFIFLVRPLQDLVAF